MIINCQMSSGHAFWEEPVAFPTIPEIEARIGSTEGGLCDDYIVSVDGRTVVVSRPPIRLRVRLWWDDLHDDYLAKMDKAPALTLSEDVPPGEAALDTIERLVARHREATADILRADAKLPHIARPRPSEEVTP